MKNNLKQIRFELKMSQAKLAEAAEISRVTLTQIENEKTVPDGDTIAKLVKATGHRASDIFFDLDVV